ncbi:DUF2079 domain-containing protein [Elusimicrobiota bacterium]
MKNTYMSKAVLIFDRLVLAALCLGVFKFILGKNPSDIFRALLILVLLRIGLGIYYKREFLLLPEKWKKYLCGYCGHIPKGFFVISVIYAGMILLFAQIARHQLLKTGWDMTFHMTAMHHSLSTWDFMSAIPPFHLFSSHAFLGMYLLVPFFKAFQSASTLFVFQTAAFLASVWMAYFIAKNTLKNSDYAVLFAILFMFNNKLREAMLYDFHPIMLAMPCLLAAIYFWQKSRIAGFVLSVFAAAIFKETVYPIAIFWGAMLILPRIKDVFAKKKAKEWAWAGIGLFLVVIFSAALYYYRGVFLPQQAVPEMHLGNVDQFASTQTGMMINALLKPWKALALLFDDGRDKFFFTWGIFKSFGFLSLLSPYFLIPSLGTWAYCLFLLRIPSEGPHYMAELMPFAYLAALHGFKKLTDKKPKYIAHVLFIVVLMSLSQIGKGDMYWIKKYMKADAGHVEFVSRIEEVSRNKNVVTNSDYIMPHIFRCAKLLQLTRPGTLKWDPLKAQVVILDLEKPVNEEFSQGLARMAKEYKIEQYGHFKVYIKDSQAG